MTPTETLKHEHEIILHVLEAAEQEVEFIEISGTVRGERIEKMLDFFRNFADRCHHMKEERQLFIRMQERGLPAQGGPIAVMLMEHEAGRAFVRGVADALPAAERGDPAEIEKVQGNLVAYIGMLRSHIAKENNVLFPMADRMLLPEDQLALTEAFERVEREEMGKDTHERYHQLAHEL